MSNMRHRDTQNGPPQSSLLVAIRASAAPRPCCSPAAVPHLSRGSAVSKGIRFNAVAPGPVRTPLNVTGKPAEKVATFGQDTPMQRPAQPEEVVPTLVFLASSSDSSYITGEIIARLGGETSAA